MTQPHPANLNIPKEVFSFILFLVQTYHKTTTYMFLKVGSICMCHCYLFADISKLGPC